MAEEEPKYLRRQKPLEIKRRKFGRRAWIGYLRIGAWCFVGLVCAGAAYAAGRFLYFAPEMQLLHPEQIDVKDNQYVPRQRVLEIFAIDRGHSLLRIPLDVRRRQLESIPWIEHAVVRRALPNRLQVEIVERTPVAFLRQGSDLALIDSHGVILDRPMKARLHFPVVSGISAEMPAEDRESRMQLYSSFAAQIDAARPGSLDHVSEVDLSDLEDLRATISGGPVAGTETAAGSASLGSAWSAAASPIVVHFGNSDFEGKYRTLVENIGQWRATVGRVDSVDLRFGREAVVNPDTAAAPPAVAQSHAAQSAPPAQKQPTPKVAQHKPVARPARKAGKKAAKRDA